MRNSFNYFTAVSLTLLLTACPLESQKDALEDWFSGRDSNSETDTAGKDPKNTNDTPELIPFVLLDPIDENDSSNGTPSGTYLFAFTGSSGIDNTESEPILPFTNPVDNFEFVFPESESGKLHDPVLPNDTTDYDLNTSFADEDLLIPLAKQFTIDIFETEREANPSLNFVTSPASALTIASILSYSANNESKAIIDESLDWDNLTQPELREWSELLRTTHTFDTQVWGQANYVFNTGYIETLVNGFDSQFTELDFLGQSMESNQTLEYWIEENAQASGTNPVFQNTNHRTRLALANNFSATIDLTESFTDIEVIEGLWQNSDNTQEKLPMLRINGTFPVYKSEEFKSVSIPLANDTLTLTLAVALGQKELENLSLKTILTEIHSNTVYQDLQVLIPEFSIDTIGNIAELIPDGIYFEDVQNASTGASSTPNFNSTLPNRETISDYSNISDVAILERTDIAQNSQFTISLDGLTTSAMTTSVLSEPVNLPSAWAENVNISGFNGVVMAYLDWSGSASTLSMRGYELESCSTKEENAGPTQARPFLFFLTDTATQAVLQVGQVATMAGETATGKEVCLSEVIEFPEQIWQNLSLDLSLDLDEAATTHISSTDFVENLLPVAETDGEQTPEQITGEALLNKLMLDSFSALSASESDSVADSDPVSISNDEKNSSYSFNEFYVSLLSRLAAPENIFNQWLASIGNQALTRADVIEAINLVASDNFKANNKLWVQTDYETKADYLGFASNNLGADVSTRDFFNDFATQKDIAQNWLQEKIEKPFDFGHLVGNRTRLLFASVTNEIHSFSGTQTDISFSNSQRYYANVSGFQFSGKFPYLENESIKAINITENGTGLVVIMPKSDTFETIEQGISDTLELVEKNASPQQIDFVLPSFTINEGNKETTIETNEFYSNASEKRPLLPLPQHSYNSVVFDSNGFSQNSYSINSLVAPNDEGEVGRIFSGSFYYITYSGIQINSLCPLKKDHQPLADTNPFIYIIYNQSTGLINSIGKVKEIDSQYVTCWPTASFVEWQPDPLPIITPPSTKLDPTIVVTPIETTPETTTIQ